jgi:hypothetical protein
MRVLQFFFYNFQLYLTLLNIEVSIVTRHLKRIQTGSDSCPASCLMGTVGYFRGIKRRGCKPALVSLSIYCRG